MYKRFIRWASDRLADDGIIAFITNRAYIDARQDDGFRKIAAQEFSDIYLMDLGSDVRRNPKISGTTHNVFGIQTGVAVGFFVREKAKRGKCGIHYTKREDAEIAVDKLAYLSKATLDGISFNEITPDRIHSWLNQSDSDFQRLLPLADRKTKLAKTADDERAVFGLFSNAVVTHRDEWVFDFSRSNLAGKIRYFSDVYEKMRSRQISADFDDSDIDTSIKWDRELLKYFRRNIPIRYSPRHIVESLYRPFTKKYLYYLREVNAVQYQMPVIFPEGISDENKVICFRGLGTTKSFHVLATDKLIERQFLSNMQCLPLYRYTEDGERVSNITDWGLRRINAHYRREFGKHFEEVVGGESITAEDVFAYTYAVLHDPVYRHDYAVDLFARVSAPAPVSRLGCMGEDGARAAGLALGI